MKTRKNITRIDENTLVQIINESVKSVLSELDSKTWLSAAQKAHQWRKDNPYKYDRNRPFAFADKARDEFFKKYGLEGQYDGKRYGGEKGTINLNFIGNGDTPKVSGSRDHDFGDENPHNLQHNVYHMSKDYGTNGNYGRTRMWDYAHETTPSEFYGSEEMGKKFTDFEKEIEDFNDGKFKYVKGKGWIRESAFGQGGNGVINGDLYGTKLSKQGSDYAQDLLKQQGIKNDNPKYTHFAVNKTTNKIVNGWDYHDIDKNELKMYKRDYFFVDLEDYGFNTKNYKILTREYLLRNGIDPEDNSNWANV